MLPRQLRPPSLDKINRGYINRGYIYAKKQPRDPRGIPCNHGNQRHPENPEGTEVVYNPFPSPVHPWIIVDELQRGPVCLSPAILLAPSLWRVLRTEAERAKRTLRPQIFSPTPPVGLSVFPTVVYLSMSLGISKWCTLANTTLTSSCR